MKSTNCILLNDVRGRIMNWWNALAVLIFFILLIQAFTGKIEGIEVTVWVWASCMLLPCLILLNLGIWLNRVPVKILSKRAFYTIFSVTTGYLWIVLFTLVLEEWAVAHSSGVFNSIEVYLFKSYGWLMPLNLLSTIAFGTLFFSRDSFHRTETVALTGVAQERVHVFRKKGHLDRAKIMEKIVANEIDWVFNYLLDNFRKNSVADLEELVVLQHEYNEIKRAADINTISLDEARRVTNRITLALMHLSEKSV